MIFLLKWHPWGPRKPSPPSANLNGPIIPPYLTSIVGLPSLSVILFSPEAFAKFWVEGWMSRLVRLFFPRRPLQGGVEEVLPLYLVGAKRREKFAQFVDVSVFNIWNTETVFTKNFIKGRQGLLTNTSILHPTTKRIHWSVAHRNCQR